MEAYHQMWKAIIRPPRSTYQISDLGPTEINIGCMNVVRTDLEITGFRGHKMQCSHFEPKETERLWDEMPCIIFMHGNSSSRAEAVELMPYILQSNMTLFCFDFAGCGLSEGEFISLGWHERDDVNVIINFLRSERKVNTVGLWGRSMGAATALLHANRDPSIAGMVLDSAFSDLKLLVNELARTHTKVPSFLVSTALGLIRGSVQSRANFDIYNLKPIANLSECFIPALFAHGQHDTFILPHHSEMMFEKYAGDKNIIKFEGGHNSPRPQFFYDSAVIFLIGTLQVEQLLTEENKMNEQQREWWKERGLQRKATQQDIKETYEKMYGSQEDYNDQMQLQFLNENQMLEAAIKASLSETQQSQNQQVNTESFTEQVEDICIYISSPPKQNNDHLEEKKE